MAIASIFYETGICMCVVLCLQRPLVWQLCRQDPACVFNLTLCPPQDRCSVKSEWDSLPSASCSPSVGLCLYWGIWEDPWQWETSNLGVWLLVKNLCVIFQTWPAVIPTPAWAHSQSTAVSEGSRSRGPRPPLAMLSHRPVLAQAPSLLGLYLRPRAEVLFRHPCWAPCGRGSLEVTLRVLTQSLGLCPWNPPRSPSPKLQNS